MQEVKPNIPAIGHLRCMRTIKKVPGIKSRVWVGLITIRIYFIVGCIDDIRLEGKHLPLPTALNGTQWGQATNWRNLAPNCPSNKPCANVICPPPFECVDLWNEYECA